MKTQIEVVQKTSLKVSLNFQSLLTVKEIYRYLHYCVNTYPKFSYHMFREALADNTCSYDVLTMCFFSCARKWT